MKIGIDLGGSHIAIGVVNKDGNIVEKIEKRLSNVEKNKLKTVIIEYIIENIKLFEQKYQIREIGIAIPGTVQDGKIIKSVNLGIQNWDIVNELKQNINLKVKIRNDAKCAAIAEDKYGCLKQYNRSIFLTLGTRNRWSGYY